MRSIILNRSLEEDPSTARPDQLRPKKRLSRRVTQDGALFRKHYDTLAISGAKPLTVSLGGVGIAAKTTATIPMAASMASSSNDFT